MNRARTAASDRYLVATGGSFGTWVRKIRSAVTKLDGGRSNSGVVSQ
jgi:hypothetical protein